MSDFDQPSAIQRVQALEAWEAEYRRFTTEFEERQGRKLEDEMLLGWRACYVELNPVTVPSRD